VDVFVHWSEEIFLTGKSMIFLMLIGLSEDIDATAQYHGFMSLDQAKS
jgi:hypothetical protein